MLLWFLTAVLDYQFQKVLSQMLFSFMKCHSERVICPCMNICPPMHFIARYHGNGYTYQEFSLSLFTEVQIADC
ncbi:hypothetical protein BDV25DRAFT_71991 [Aspergillus avenaceus]|uniref:Uncharacterized protein n=1 Tax=Aspergillus avenaceus TaxID=36643 RepID=A0A5N6U261_ASPAV|nr:hypothetical protein BDV25DRAFT_71991 [Aspergillus avenaceus]